MKSVLSNVSLTKVRRGLIVLYKFHYRSIADIFSRAVGKQKAGGVEFLHVFFFFSVLCLLMWYNMVLDFKCV